MGDVAVPFAIKLSALMNRTYCAAVVLQTIVKRGARFPDLTKYLLNLPHVYPGIHQRSQKKGPCGISRHHSPTSLGVEVHLSFTPPLFSHEGFGC